MSRGLAVACAVALMAGSVHGQPASPRITSVTAIHADPAAFHGELVQITGTVTREGEHIVLSHSGNTLRLLSREPIPTGDVEVRGVVLDVGRLERDDPRLLPRRTKAAPGNLPRTSWPAPGEEIAVAVRSVTAQSREVVAIAVAPVSATPLEVDFSAPMNGEADVRLDARIRLQFSGDVDASSLTGHIRITYSQSDSVERGEAQPPIVAFGFNYNKGTRALEIRPTQPLERFRRVKVELLEGIVGTDGSALGPWALNFTTGGS